MFSTAGGKPINTYFFITRKKIPTPRGIYQLTQEITTYNYSGVVIFPLHMHVLNYLVIKRPEIPLSYISLCFAMDEVLSKKLK